MSIHVYEYTRLGVEGRRSPEPALKRRDLFWLVKMKQDLEEFVHDSESGFISREKRKLSAGALTIFQKIFDEQDDLNVDEVILLLQQPILGKITPEVRSQIATCIQQLLQCSEGEIDSFSTKDDDERFDLMTDEHHRARPGVTQVLFGEMGVMNFRIESRTFKLVGSKSNEEFYSLVSKEWKFAEPKKYFDYFGDATEWPVLT
jgi:hypothetical protein